MNLTRAVLLALSLGACATTPALPELPGDHPAREDAAETVAPERTRTLGAALAAEPTPAPAPAPAPGGPGPHDTRSHR